MVFDPSQHYHFRHLDRFPFRSVAEIFTVERETRALHYIKKSELVTTGISQKPIKNR